MEEQKGRPNAVADLRGGAGDAPPPPGVQILSISCSFWEILAKLYVGAPPPGELAPPPRGNPGSATEMYNEFPSFLYLFAKNGFSRVFVHA